MDIIVFICRFILGALFLCIGWVLPFYFRYCGNALHRMFKERAWKRRVREDIEELTQPQ